MDEFRELKAKREKSKKEKTKDDCEKVYPEDEDEIQMKETSPVHLEEDDESNSNENSYVKCLYCFFYFFVIRSTHFPPIHRCRDAIAKTFVGWSHDCLHCMLFLSDQKCHF
jgi:hypothetical protein